MLPYNQFNLQVDSRIRTEPLQLGALFFHLWTDADLKLTYSSGSHTTAGTARYTNINGIQNLLYPYKPEGYSIHFHRVIRGKMIHEALDRIPDFTPVKNLEMALTENIQHYIRCYAHKNSLIIITNNLSDNVLRRTLSYYIKTQAHNKEKYNDELMLLLAKKPDQFLEKGKAIIEPLLKNILAQKWEKEITPLISNWGMIQLQEDLKYYQREIEHYETTLVGYYNNKARIEREIFAATHGNNQTEELINFLKSNKNIIDLNMLDKRLTIAIETPITTFDSEYCKKYFNKALGNYTEAAQKMLTEIFINKKYSVYARGAFTIDFNTNPTTWRVNNDAIPDKFSHYCNSHLYYARCTGTYKNSINKALADRNLMSTIITMLASTGNLNFPDGIIAPKIIADLTTMDIMQNTKVKDNSTKEICTLKQLFERMKDDETNQINITTDSENIE